MEINEVLLWSALGAICICMLVLIKSPIVSAIGCLSAIVGIVILWIWLGRRRTESFGDTVFMCTDGASTCSPQEPEIGPFGLDENAFASLPLKACDLYLTDNIAECDSGLYDKHILELKERLVALEQSPVANRKEIEQIQKVLRDAARLPKRQCKLKMSNWVRPQHSSFPALKAMSSDYAPRGNPRHWAYCYAPMDKANSLTFLKQGLERNTKLVGETVVLTGTSTKLSNNVMNQRLEFTTMEPEQIRKTYCNFFYPLRDAKVMSFYQLFRNPEKSIFYAVDMTPEGVIRNLQLYRWFNGYLQLIPSWKNESVKTCQDDTTGLVAIGKFPQETPDRFNLETSYYCDPKPLRKTVGTYRKMLRKLFTETVNGKQLMLTLKDTTSAYQLNINICNRVDSVVSLTINLMEMLGNAVPRNITIHGSAGKTQAELCELKKAKREEICKYAIEMNRIYHRLKEISEEQKRHAEDYREYSKPDTNVGVIMKPETSRVMPILQSLRAQEVTLQRKFAEFTIMKKAAVAEVLKINTWLAEIEMNIDKVIDRMIVVIKGKRIAIRDKPYQYISNDGRVYFQL